jgi:extradiol dioxygenase family protein
MAMPDGAQIAGSATDAGERPFRISYLFHPTCHVLDLDETERFYERVFGVTSRRMAYKAPDPDNRWDYSTFALLHDVLMDSLDPKRMIFEGVQQYAIVDEPHLKTLGWWVEDATEMYHWLRARDVRLVSVLGRETGDEVPVVMQSSTPQFFTVPADYGIRYQFIEHHFSKFDARTHEGWQPPLPADSPLGIEATSHHTVLTDDPNRALPLFDLIGAKRIHAGRSELIGAESVFVQLADAVYEFAVPDEGTSAYADLQTIDPIGPAQTAPKDKYHAITFKVTDLAKARRHLVEQGVGIRTETDTTVITDPKTSNGIPWGFTTEWLPGDNRA